MARYEAIEDDARPGEWIVVPVDPEGDEGPEMARFRARDAGRMARRFAAMLDADDDGPLPWYWALPDWVYVVTCIACLGTLLLLIYLWP